MTSITQHRGNELAVRDDQDFWNEKQIAALRQLGVETASKAELAVFHHVCQRTGLDPFARQIYMIERAEGGGGKRQTIQTGIDGFRLVARRAVERTGETLSYAPVEWCGPDREWTDVWTDDGPPVAARITVYRNGQPFPAIALWREYAQTKGGGGLTLMWRTRGAGQLAKCAEALAIRKGFPQELSGLYTEDEVGAHRVVDAEPAPPRVTAAEIKAQAPPCEDDDDTATRVGEKEQLWMRILAAAPEGWTREDVEVDFQKQMRHSFADATPGEMRDYLGGRGE